MSSQICTCDARDCRGDNGVIEGNEEDGGYQSNDYCGQAETFGIFLEGRAVDFCFLARLIARSNAGDWMTFEFSFLVDRASSGRGSTGDRQLLFRNLHVLIKHVVYRLCPVASTTVSRLGKISIGAREVFWSVDVDDGMLKFGGPREKEVFQAVSRIAMGP